MNSTQTQELNDRVTRSATTRGDSMVDPGLRRRYLETIMGVRFSSENKVEVLQNGVGIFPPMLKAIREAKVSIELLTYVYWKGRIAEEFADALAEKAREGVKVRLLLDAFGAAPMPSRLTKRMHKAGVDIAWFRSLTKSKPWQYDQRTHRKILVCDNRVGFTGGVGIAKEWEGNARRPSEWRDTHLRMEGPCVAGLTGAFWDGWFQVRGYEELPDERLVKTGGFEPKGETSVQIIRSSAQRAGSENMALLSALVKLARERLDIITAYFVPTELMIDKLCRKVADGTRIRVILPGDHTDHRFDQLASEDCFQQMLDCGVQIFRYQKTMLHAKILLVDDDLAAVGSTNFNNRSLQKDDEVSAVMSDPEIVRQLDEDLRKDLLDCEQVHRWKWAKRPVWQRVGEVVTKPFRHQL